MTIKPTDPQITLFACPKPFIDHNAIIQRNAIQSWTKIPTLSQIILLGNDAGTADIAEEFNLDHIPNICCNEFGVPFVNDLFKQAEAKASGDVLIYVNADIILSSDLLPAIKRVTERFEKFLIIEQRWDLDVTTLIDFTDNEWETKLKKLRDQQGQLHPTGGIDCFVYSRGLYKDMPAFVLGRTAWDNWLVITPLDAGCPVIDATGSITLIHQNHDYCHAPGGKQEIWSGNDTRTNRMLAGGRCFVGTISYATWELSTAEITQRSSIKRALLPYNEGMKNLGQGLLEIAFKWFDEAAELSPNMDGVHFNRAVALAGLGRQSEALMTAKQETNRKQPGLIDTAINNRIQNILAQAKPLKLAIWGAGEHTRFLFTHTTILNQVLVSCIFDNNLFKNGFEIYGVAIVAPPPSDVEAMKSYADAIIISSKCSENDIYKQLSYLEDAGIGVYKLYNPTDATTN